MLSLLIFLPFIAIFIITALPLRRYYLHKVITLITTSVQLLVSVIIYLTYDPSGPLQFVEQFDWITLPLGSMGKLSAEYFVGIDGLNVSMVLLSAIVMFVGTLASWHIKENRKGYFSLYLLLCSTIPGCFVALDFLLFFIFFEFMLLPMYFLIGLWGGERREYASIKFFLYTLAGSIFILLVMIALYISVADPVKSSLSAGITDVSIFKQQLASGNISRSDLVHTFNMTYMKDVSNFIPGSLLHASSEATLFGLSVRLIAFLAIMIGFAIKLPAVPFHTWLPDAHVEAPTPISVVLAGVLLKIGGYGMMRIGYSIFPEGGIHFAWLVGLIGVISIVYGALNALAMKDLKKMIAYSSISHMGFVMLGLASLTVEGLNGAMYQMFSHGIIASLLFLITGVLYDRTHDRMIENYRGLATKMPVYTAVVVVAFFASFGLPGFSGFIAELLILLGAFNAEFVNGLLSKWLAIVAASGILIGAVYYLWTLQRMFFGKWWIKTGITWKEGLYDLDARELLMMVPLVILAIAFGLFPSMLLNSIAPAMKELAEFVLASKS